MTNEVTRLGNFLVVVYYNYAHKLRYVFIFRYSVTYIIIFADSKQVDISVFFPCSTVVVSCEKMFLVRC